MAKRSGLTDFVSAFGPALSSGFGQYVNLMSVIGSREFNQQLGLSNRVTALTSAADSYQKSIVDYNTKIQEQGGHPSSELLNARDTAQSNLDLTRLQLQNIYGNAMKNTGLNTGLASSFFNTNPGYLQTVQPAKSGFLGDFKAAYTQATQPTTTPDTKVPANTVDNLLNNMDSSRSPEASNQDDLRTTLQMDFFKRLGIDPVQLTNDQFNIVKNREHYLTNIGDPGKRRRLFDQALSIPNDKDFFAVYQATQPDDKDGNAEAFRQLERTKILLDNQRNLYNISKESVGHGVQDLADQISSFTEDRTIETRKKMNANEGEYIIFARDLKGPPPGANIAPIEYLGIKSGFPSATSDSGTFERDAAAFELKLDQLYQTLLSNVKKSAKDYGAYEDPMYLAREGSKKATDLNNYDYESLMKLSPARWVRNPSQGRAPSTPVQPTTPTRPAPKPVKSSFIKNEEGLRLEAYPDGNGYAIGYGNRTIDGKPVTPGMRITQEQAEKAYKSTVRDANKLIDSTVQVKLTGKQRHALQSFIYNAGPGAYSDNGIADLINAGDFKGAANKMSRFVYSDTPQGKVKNETLIARRQREAEMLLDGVNINKTTVSEASGENQRLEGLKGMIKSNPQQFVAQVKGKKFDPRFERLIQQAVQELQNEGYDF